jgi:hypothetical protein
MATIDLKKDIKPLIKVDWTRMDGSQAFFQKAEGDLDDRYSITVVTSETTTEGSEDKLQDIKDNAIPVGYQNVLEFYEKVDNDPTSSGAAFAEDWYVSERPGSKIKVLISVPTALIDGLADEPPPLALPPPWAEMYFNTFDLEEKIKGTTELLNKYNANIQRFRGKVLGLNLKHETDNFSNSLMALAGLMQSNGYSYDSSRSDLLIFGIDSEYKFLYGQIDEGKGIQTLYKGFKKFQKSPIGTNKRTVNFLFNLDKIYNIYLKNENIPMETFFNDYVINPPTYDFSEPGRRSNTDGIAGPSTTAEDNSKPQKTTLELEDFAVTSKADRKNAQKVLDSSAEFVGDTVVGSLQTITDGITLGTGYLTRNPGNYLSKGIFKNVLNKIPLQSLIEGALECSGFQGFEYLNMAKAYLNQAASFFDNVANLLTKTIPTLSIPDDFPIADYMKDLGLKILMGILEAVLGMLIQMLVELLQQLLEACNECALANEAEGRSRFDGMNFGAFNIGDSLLKTMIVGTVGEAGSTMMRESGANQISREVLGETERWAKNPLLTAGLDLAGTSKYTPGVRTETSEEEIQQKIENAKTDLSEYVNASSQVLTPGEMGNLLLGCATGREALDAVTNLLDNFPRLKVVLVGQDVGEGSDSLRPKVQKMWEDFGKLFGPSSILGAVKEVTDAMPESVKCLCDADDTAMRQSLLAGKGLSASQIKDQIDKSRARKQQRLEDLAKMLEKGDLLGDATPAIFCKMVYRDEQGEIIPPERVMTDPNDNKKFISKETKQEVHRGIQPGLVEKDHPSLIFMMNKVLSTIYDSIAMAFNENLEGLIPILTKQPIVERPIKRTIRVTNPDGTSERQLNQEWVSMVQDQNLRYSFGALPADAAQPGKNIIRWMNEPLVGRDTEEEANGVVDDPDLAWPAGDEIRDRLVGGQMSTGQTQPTAEQEYEWEISQIRPGPAQYVTSRGRRRASEYDTTNRGGQKLAEYTNLYGYSPIPITVKERAPSKFAPGLKKAYQTMCINEGLFNITDNDNSYHYYNFKVDNNLFETAGMTDVAMELITNKVIPSIDAAPSLPEGIDPQIARESISGIVEAFQSLHGSSYDIKYIVPYSVSLADEARNGNRPKDQYGITILLTTAAGSAPPFVVYRDTKEDSLSDNIYRAFHNCIYSPTLQHIPQEQLFVSWNYNQAWPNGPSVIRPDGGLSLRGAGVGLLGDGNAESLGDYLYDKRYGDQIKYSAYDGLWRDYYCSFTKMIAESPLMELSKLSTLDLIPMNKIGQECDINASLLDFEIIKQRIKDEYGLIQCIEASFPNVDGLGTNKDNPFEKANLSGAVLLTVRTYVLEVMLRSIYCFYWFRFSTPDSVDSLLVSYIAQLLKKDVAQKAFLREFRIETLDLYNRNAPNLTPPRAETKNFDVALEYFIRYQIFGVSNRLSKVVGAAGKTDLDSYLLQKESAEEPAWIPEYSVPRELNGIRDGGTGNNQILENDSYSAGDGGSNNPVPADKALVLASNGTLSEEIIAGLWMEDLKRVSTLRNLPVGMLMRKYFGTDAVSKAEIWSKEAPRYPLTQGGEDWQYITGVEALSPNKQSNTGLNSPYKSRESQILRGAGLLDSSNSWTTDKGILALNPIPGGDPNIPDSTSDEAYNYGISLGEQKSMAIFLRFLAAGFHDDLNWSDKATELDDYIKTFTRTNSGGAVDVLSFYPGKILKDITAQKSGQKSWTFKHGQVWDKRAWGGEGVEPPQWIRDSFGEEIDFGRGTGQYDFGIDTPVSVPSISFTTNAQGDGGSPLNYQYSAFDRGSAHLGFQGNRWYRSMEQVRRKNADPDEPGADAPADYVDLDWRRLAGLPADAEPDIEDFGRLRWITIGNQVIGPWKGWYLNTQPGNRSNQGQAKRRGAPLSFKLIDPGYRYHWDGTKQTQNESWGGPSNTIGYNSRTSGAIVRGRESEGFIEGLGIRNPDRLELQENTGITVGVNFKNLSFFNLQPTSFNSQTGYPENPRSDTNPWVNRLLQRAVNLLETGMPYLSLLDFDILSIKKILVWEKEEAKNLYETEAFWSELSRTYDEWINHVTIMIRHFKEAEEGRQLRRELLFEEIVIGGTSRAQSPPETNPGKSFENGNFIQEYYIRVEELDYQGMPYETNANLASNDTAEEIITQHFQGDQEFRRGIEEVKWKNSNYVDVDRTEFLKGVINIKKFQEYINTRFNSQGEIPANVLSHYQQNLSADCLPNRLTKALITDLARFMECGEAKAQELGVSVSPDRDYFVLGDFFKSVHVGLRISYVNPMPPQPVLAEPFGPAPAPPGAATSCWRNHELDPTVQFYRGAAQGGFNQGLPFGKIAREASNTVDGALYQKAFFVSNTDNAPFEEVANVIPLVCSEVPVDLDTRMRDVVNGHADSRVPLSLRMNGGMPFFEFQYKLKHQTLIEQLKASSEYQALFRYLFPLPRMLSLNNIYGSEYLRSYKGISELFDPTKFRLKDLFFGIYNSGNYPSTDCGPSNLDLQLGAMNGHLWGGLAATIGIMILKTSVLIFKGFVEATDTNIAVSKQIRDAIHLINQIIAQAQIMANQTQQAPEGEEDCGPGAPGSPQKPPDAWLEPINENFIPEPQIMFISLALLPITLLPMIWPGIPITPFGLAYWGMDWRPEPNWLNSMPPADWLDKLLSKGSGPGAEMGGPNDEDCDIDVGMPPLEPGEI